MDAPTFDVVVPTVGRPSLAPLLGALAASSGPAPGAILLVDDRRDPRRPLLPGGLPSGLAAPVVVLRGRAAGPAAARNAGWRAAAAPWIAFLDDDVVPEPDWLARLADDLTGPGDDVAASQGRIRVPLPEGRRPTDWERNVHGLERAQWATADMAYRRDALAAVGGFDERFPRAFREDADLGLRVVARGWRIVTGARAVAHPARAADRWVSVRLQAGNADDPLMRALHGRWWRARAGVPRGRLRRHVAITAAAAAGVAAALAGRRRLAAAGLAAWAAGTAELAWARIAPGPRTRDEVVTMLATSLVLPHAATWHWLRGWGRVLRRLGRLEPWPATAAGSAAPGAGSAAAPEPRAVLLDRDGTIVVDVPCNADPARVALAPGARQALGRLRAAGLRLAVVSNQSGIARGLLRPEDVDAVNRRVEELAGPLGPWLVCPHGPLDGCECRKPAPGLVLAAARALGVRPDECVVIGDTDADVGAALAAGARAILVPNGITRPEEIAAAPLVAPDLAAAVDLVLGGRR